MAPLYATCRSGRIRKDQANLFALVAAHEHRTVHEEVQVHILFGAVLGAELARAWRVVSRVRVVGDVMIGIIAGRQSWSKHNKETGNPTSRFDCGRVWSATPGNHGQALTNHTRPFRVYRYSFDSWVLYAITYYHTATRAHYTK